MTPPPGTLMCSSKVADGLIRVLKPGGVIAWNVDAIVELHKKQGTSRTGSSFRQCLYFQEQGLNFHDLIIYEKPVLVSLLPLVFVTLMCLRCLHHDEGETRPHASDCG